TRPEPQAEVVAVAVDRLHADGGQHLELVAARLGDEAVDELTTADPLGEAGVVVDALGDPGLAAEPATVEDDGVDPLPGGVDGRGETGGATADDGQVVEGALGLEGQAQPPRQLLVAGVDQGVAALREDDGGDGAAALLQLLDGAQALGLLVDVHPLVGDALLGEELLGTPAVGAPGRPVDGHVGHGRSASGSGCRAGSAAMLPCRRVVAVTALRSPGRRPPRPDGGWAGRAPLRTLAEPRDSR